MHKETARAIAHARLEHFARFYAALPASDTTSHTFTYHRVSIRNQRTRWGSCSRKGNLNFSYKLALLPPPLADYLIVHELCHLGQFNHSPAFWQLVALAIPDYCVRREELKKIKINLPSAAKPSILSSGSQALHRMPSSRSELRAR